MDYFLIIQSINKIAVIAFIAIFVLIFAEVSMMYKGKKKVAQIKIPDFRSNLGANVKVATAKIDVKKPEGKSSHVKYFVVTTLILTLFGLIIAFVIYMFPQKQNNSIAKRETIAPLVAQQATQVELVDSEGIVVFNDKWEELTGENIQIMDGEKIYLGVATIANSDVDRARIRVNSAQWTSLDEVTQFDSDKDIFYKEYVIASTESSLNIEAQLHSKVDGWLGE